MWISIPVVVGAAAVIVLATTQSPHQSTQASPTGEFSIGGIVSPAFYQGLTGVSDATLSAVGPSEGVSPPSPVSGKPLTESGKPVVLYIGGDFCPYCAAERWSLIVALSRFGSLSNLEYMVSSPSHNPANIPTFTFSHSAYSSEYVSFVAVEVYNRSAAVVQPLTPDQQALFDKYDPEGLIPFIDLGNAYVVVGAQMGDPSIMAGKNWTQVASQLNDANSQIGGKIASVADSLIGAICKVDGMRPSSVCGQPFALTLGSYSTPSSVVLVARLCTKTRGKS